ncbi:MAG: NAD(P)-binding protein, partial [Verrucomicrobiota bacterium]|nr:NAD(P)-binding protein [Verrucomicrobiota bacterium]
MHSSVEILIIGAGPAGLAAASYCAQRRKSFVVVETGQRIEMRNHADTNHLAHGVGGSGLYSDGKFSFYPSATNLWQLPDKKSLTEGYAWLCAHLSNFGMVTPEFPLHFNDDGLSLKGIGNSDIKSKKYQSFYLSLGQRKQLGEKLERACGTSLKTDVSVAKIQFEDKSRRFNCHLSSKTFANQGTIECETIIFAGGRFGPIGLFSILPETPKRF